jgi:hypothetical protein
MSHNLSKNRQIIPNSNQYFYETKYITIHSEDRDYTKYPSASEFEIFLPQEYLNVVSAKLYSWSFPANYNVFSVLSNNVTMTFKFLNLYNPGEHNTSDVLLEGIFAALYNNLDTEYSIVIETGFYNTQQMANELTNKFNESVTNVITAFFNDNPVEYAEAKSLFVMYDRFNIVYNSVSQVLWFGNSADKFVLTNDSIKINSTQPSCNKKNYLPQFANWGLPAYLGFNRCNTYAYSAQEYLENSPDDNSFISNLNVPRFYYGDTSDGDGTNGYWLLPSAPGATVYFLRAPYKISFMGPAYIYMEIDGMNYIDEIAPWNLSEYTAHNNQTNGRVNSAFAKISVPVTPIAQWFDINDSGPYKYWNPPAERISKLKLKFRYHNGQLVNFGQFEYSFMIEFNTLKPQQERSYSIRNSLDLSQIQDYSSKFI